MKLKSTTKMGYQAAIAISIAEFIGWYFQLERGYWVTLTAMALTMQTWGESVKRSLERVSMTIIGGVAGTLLYFIVPDNQVIVLILLLLFVFFTVYLLQILYLVSIFFLTFFVVFLFALMGDWTIAILFDRILETTIGALIALVVGACFFPLKTDVDALFIGFWGEINASLCIVFDGKQSVKSVISSQYLAVECQTIRKRALAIRYELLFHRMSRRDFHFLINQTTLCTQYVINLMDAYLWLVPYLSKEDSVGVHAAVQTTRHNIDVLIQRLQNEPSAAMLPVTRVTSLLDKAIGEDPARFACLESEALGFFNLMYFFARLNLCLNDVNTMLSKR